jgi:hypothetical protein
MVTPAAAAALPTNNGQLLFDSNPAENMMIVAVRPAGPNQAVVVARNTSPRLMQFCANGRHFDKVKLTCRKAGRGQQEFLQVTLTSVLISSYQVNGDGSVSIGMKYNMADGSLAGFQDIH